jgi:protocatechuate 3,4-dioxygenase beta subunit
MDQRTYSPRDWTQHGPYFHEGYRSTTLRAPKKSLVPLLETLSEITGPVFGHDAVQANDSDLTINGANGCAPLGERIVVAGQVVDENGRPVPHTLIEIWQANAAGRYIHAADRHDAPLDPNFFGAGRCVTDAEGRYRFVSIKPGAYPWENHAKAFRPAHIHFSLFGPSFVTRLVTQMYFPGDPLIPLDPIMNGIPDAGARQRLVSTYSVELTEHGRALGYAWDIVLRGSNATPFEA